MQTAPPRRLTEYSHGAGCACKLSPLELSHVLSALPVPNDPNLVAALGARDDAAVYRLSEGRALVATVDFFTPIVDEPRAFGAIAAANAVSDVYAVGGSPLLALSLVAFPRAELGNGLLEEIVAGGAEKLAEAGAVVAGGHSVDDAEPKFGYAVIGEVDPGRAVGHSGARPGDLVYLTKPLGVGVVTTAIKAGVCPPETVRAAVRVMTQLNRDAAAAMLAAGATSATDVTGYGLLGHLLNLELAAEVEASAVPYLPGARELAGRDVFPGGTRRNLEAVSRRVVWDGVEERERLLLCDAQTSGGLLVTIPADRGAEFEGRLASGPYPAARIGRVVEGSGLRVVG